MCLFFSITTIEHRNLVNFKLFLRNTDKRIREKLKRESLQKLRKLEAELAELDRRTAATEANLIVLTPYRIMTSQVQRHVMQQKNLMKTNVLSNHGQHHQGQSLRLAPTIRAILASTTSGSPNGQRNRSQHHQGQSQQSAPPKPAPIWPAPTIRAILASTITGSPNSQHNRSQHHNN